MNYVIADPSRCEPAIDALLDPRREHVGLLPDREYDEVIFQAQPDDLVILFSDGVSDHLSRSGDEYGRTRLSQVVGRCCGFSPKEIVDEIFADLDKFNTERFDDQTLIVMRVNPNVSAL